RLVAAGTAATARCRSRFAVVGGAPRTLPDPQARTWLRLRYHRRVKALPASCVVLGRRAVGVESQTPTDSHTSRGRSGYERNATSATSAARDLRHVRCCGPCAR